MHIKKLLLLTALTVLLITQGCYDTFNCESGRGSIVMEEVDIPPFTGISFEVAGNVFIRQDTAQYVMIESYPNIISAINTNVRDGIWYISFRDCFRNYDKFEVYISLPELNFVNLSGSGNITGEGPFETEDFLLSLGGSGNINLEMYCESVDAELPGSGNITLSGVTDSERLFISGSGNILASGLESNTCEARISGSGNCNVLVNEELTVVISGSGTVSYAGNPPVVNTTITGSGSVVPVN